MYSQLKKSIEKIIQLSTKEWSIVENAFTFRQISKNFLLQEERKTAKEIYFINKGILRLFYNKDGEEITAFIFSENLFASSYQSFLEQSPSNQLIESLEESELLVTTYSQIQNLYQTIPKFNFLARIVAEQRFINAQKILSSFILDTPEQRYVKFSKENPDILQRVPQHIIASFLGITAVSLSRIRKRIVS